jgi:hypothetical protein
MERLAIQLALHGAAILAVSLVAGLLLYRAILADGPVSKWHLAHSGGSGRGVLLIALAAAIHLTALPLWQVSVFVWLIVFFAWTSTLAMIIAAASGERGLGWRGSSINRLVYGLYFVGTVAVFPAAGILIVGLVRAL